MRVLVVEDEKKTASFIRKALQAEGFAVDVCHNGDDALAAARTTPFDAIVLDIMLPGRDGLSVLRQLRERRGQRHAGAAALGARARSTSASRASMPGRMITCPKPFVIAELVARVRALGRRRRRNQVSRPARGRPDPRHRHARRPAWRRGHH